MQLDGREPAAYLQERHARQVRRLGRPLKLAIVAMSEAVASASYVRAKIHYGEAIGVAVDVVTVTPTTILDGIARLNADSSVTGIIVQLPLMAPELTDAVLAAVAPAKDIDGMGPDSPFETGTPKAILWLLATYSIELKGKLIATVGQGRVVGAPLSDRLEASGVSVRRLDEATLDLATALINVEVIITATGQPGLITPAMVRPGMVVVDAGGGTRAGRLAGDLESSLYHDKTLQVTPNPGGVGPMTVAVLFDNLLLAAPQTLY